MRRGADRQGPYNVCDYDRTRTGFVGKGAVGCGQSRIIVRFIPNDQQVGNRKYSRWQYQMFRERCKHLGHIYFQVARRRFRPVGIGTMFMCLGAVGSRRKTVFEIEADTLAAIMMVMRKRRQPNSDDAQSKHRPQKEIIGMLSHSVSKDTNNLFARCILKRYCSLSDKKIIIFVIR